MQTTSAETEEHVIRCLSSSEAESGGCAKLAEQKDGDVISENEKAAVERRRKKEEKKAEFKPAPPPEPLCTWRRVLKDVWFGDEAADSKIELCQTILNEIFSEVKNPFEAVLSIHKVSPDFGIEKAKTLAGFAIEHFGKWLQKNDNSGKLFAEFVTREIQEEAFAIATEKRTVHLEKIANIFHLKDPSMIEFIYEAVKVMLTQQNYRDAISCATLFELQSRFALEQIAIPCMLQDRSAAVENYFKGNRPLQIEFVRFFDQFIGIPESVIERRFEDYKRRRIMTIPMSRLQGKTLEKMVAKLLTTYGLLAEEAAPHLCRSRQEGCLRHMAFKRFIENSVTEDGYFDYIAHGISGDPYLQRYFTSFLCNYGQFEEAVLWVVFCDMLDRVPAKVKPYLTPHNIRKAEEKIARLKLAQKNVEAVGDIELHSGHFIIMVDTAGALKQLMTVLEKASIIGIDTEWKPLFLSTIEQIALIQISINDCSYLVDVLVLEKVLLEEDWILFFKALFCSQDSIKLGFDFANDLRVLRTSFPFLEAVQPAMSNVICIVKLVDSLLAEDSSFVDLNCDEVSSCSYDECISAEESASDELIHFKLSDLCERVLGEPLDKREQVGNWARRPLREEQMRYAARDAFCLLQIYDKLKLKAEKNGINWETHLANGDVTRIKPKEPKKTKKKTKLDDNEFLQMIERVNSELEKSSVPGRRPSEIKIIVDSMMLGLGRHLRRCGINTLLAETRTSLVREARKDPKRFILTNGKAFNELRQQPFLHSSARILCIPSLHSMNAIEQVEFVLRHFKLRLCKEDIFSRCMKCNSDCFVRAPSPVLEAMYHANVAPLSSFSEEQYDAKKYYEKMKNVDPAMYSGYGCSLTAIENDLSWISASCYNGVFDVKNCLVSAVGHIPVKVHIEKVPLPALQKEGRFFYVCGECGKVYWDGCHITNYSAFIGKLLNEESPPFE